MEAKKKACLIYEAQDMHHKNLPLTKLWKLRHIVTFFAVEFTEGLQEKLLQISAT